MLYRIKPKARLIIAALNLFIGLHAVYAQDFVLTWDRLGCQQDLGSKLNYNEFQSAPCLKVCPNTMFIYRMTGEAVKEIDNITWEVTGGTVDASKELVTPINWDETTEGSIKIILNLKDATHLEKTICVEKISSALILGWDKIGCQLDKDNVNEIKFSSITSETDCLKVCPESSITYAIFGEGADDIESFQWTVVGGSPDSVNKPRSTISWDNTSNGSIHITVVYKSGGTFSVTICIRKIQSSLLLDWEKIDEASVSQIKYDNSEDNPDCLLVYPESTVLYRILGKDLENVESVHWTVIGGYAYNKDQTVTPITWDDVEKNALTIDVVFKDGSSTQRNYNVFRIDGSIGGANALNAVQFTYDDLGNQIKRAFIYLPRHKNPDEPLNPAKELIIPQTLIKSDIYNDISYYPNPVRSELYVEWKIENNETVRFIELYDLNGKLVNRFSDQDNRTNITINFEAFPSGLYTLLLSYSGGATKSLKIIKQ